jgi:pyruvate formate lyase activating enzyme
VQTGEYLIHEPGEVELSLAEECLRAQDLRPDHTVLMLPFGSKGRVGFETRRLYFALALDSRGKFNSEPALRGRSLDDHRQLLPVTRIVSFGDCNVACPYCKRDCQFLGDDGKPIVAVRVPALDLFGLAEGAVARGETARFSGGDPVLFPRETLAISEYLSRRHGAKTSIAHNGSGPGWVRRILPYLSSAAIDLKAVPEKMGRVMGVSSDLGARIFQLSLETQRIISEAGNCLLDVRTPVFGDTPLAEMQRLGEHISGLDPSATFWTWRMYKPVLGCDWAVPEKERMFEMMATVSEAMPRHWIGVRAKWQKGGMVYFRAGRQVNSEESGSISDAEARGSGNLPATAGEGA